MSGANKIFRAEAPRGQAKVNFVDDDDVVDNYDDIVVDVVDDVFDDVVDYVVDVLDNDDDDDEVVWSITIMLAAMVLMLVLMIMVVIIIEMMIKALNNMELIIMTMIDITLIKIQYHVDRPPPLIINILLIKMIFYQMRLSVSVRGRQWGRQKVRKSSFELFPMLWKCIMRKKKNLKKTPQHHRYQIHHHLHPHRLFSRRRSASGVPGRRKPDSNSFQVRIFKKEKCSSDRLVSTLYHNYPVSP